MADAHVIHLGENSPELIAFKLLTIIAANEKKTFNGTVGAPPTADRQWLLDAYAECLLAVTQPSARIAKEAPGAAAPAKTAPAPRKKTRTGASAD